MTGLLWTAALSVGALLVYRAWWRLLGRDGPIDRELVALILVLLGTASTTARSAEDVLATPLVGETLIRGALDVAALLVVAPVLAQRIGQRRDVRFRGMTGLTAYVAMAGLSASYSVAFLPTAGKAFELGVGILVVWAIALRHDAMTAARRAIEVIVFLGALEVIIAVIGFVAWPPLFAEVQDRTPFIGRATMVSPYAHSNALSAEGALVAAYAMVGWFETPPGRRVFWGLIAVFGTVGMLLASARQGLAIWIAAVAVILWRYRRRLLVVLVPVVGWLVSSNWEAVWDVVSRSQRASTLATWSGRLVWWQSAIEAWMEHPWTGYGFGAGGRFVALARIGKTGISSVHSGYLEALVGVGLLGFIPLVYCIWRATRWAIGRYLRGIDVQLAILMVPLLLHTAVSLGFAGWLQPSVLVFALLVALTDVYRVERLDAAQTALSMSSR